jgi:hypothetical protein
MPVRPLQICLPDILNSTAAAAAAAAAAAVADTSISFDILRTFELPFNSARLQQVGFIYNSFNCAIPKSLANERWQIKAAKFTRLLVK